MQQDAAMGSTGKAQTGPDVVAIEHVYRAESERLWRSLVGFGGSREIADDAVAEAFAQALAHRGPIDHPARWVWKAAFSIAAGELKRRRRSSTLDIERSFESPDPVVDLTRALATLPSRQRAVIVLHDYADRPTREIAAILGIAHPTVRVHLSQGRARLRRLLEDSDD